MSDTVRILLFLAGYIVLMKWVLPWLGVGTCMSGGCAIPHQGKRTALEKPDETAGGAAHPQEER